MKKTFLTLRTFTASFLLGILAILPVQAQHIAAGKFHSLYLDNDGNVWVWGNSSLDSVTNEQIPQLAMEGASAVFAPLEGELSFVLRENGALWGWGDTNNGELRIIPEKRYSDQRYIEKPLKITNNITSVTGTRTIFALKHDGSLWVWGSLGSQRGDNIKKNYIKPVKVMNDVAQVSSADFHTLALKKDGTLLAWGDNQCGALGIGNTKKHVKPVRVNVKALGKRKIAKILARNGDSFIIAEDGSVWNWGEPNLTYPYCHDEPRLMPTRLNIDNVKDIALQDSGEIFLKKDGTVWKLSLDRANPDAPPYWKKLMDNVSEITGGKNHYIALKNDGTVWTWGNNQFGQIGNGSNEYAEDPVQVKFPK